ncbi:MAG: hypothetical protein C4304_05420 [candidate division GAL15 bacterium]
MVYHNVLDDPLHGEPPHREQAREVLPHEGVHQQGRGDEGQHPHHPPTRLQDQEQPRCPHQQVGAGELARLQHQAVVVPQEVTHAEQPGQGEGHIRPPEEGLPRVPPPQRVQEEHQGEHEPQMHRPLFEGQEGPEPRRVQLEQRHAHGHRRRHQGIGSCKPPVPELRVRAGQQLL